MDKLTLVLKEEKQTKRTVRFKEMSANDEAVVGPLYIQKRALKEIGSPKKLRVTIEPVR